MYRREILEDIQFGAALPVAKFYHSLFLNLDLSSVQESPLTERKMVSCHTMICTFIVMKCEGFSMISDLLD